MQNIPPRKGTTKWKIHHLKMYLLLKTWYYFHLTLVSFHGCICNVNSDDVKIGLVDQKIKKVPQVHSRPKGCISPRLCLARNNQDGHITRFLPEKNHCRPMEAPEIFATRNIMEKPPWEP